jgi:hypothetical protein
MIIVLSRPGLRFDVSGSFSRKKLPVKGQPRLKVLYGLQKSLNFNPQTSNNI